MNKTAQNAQRLITVIQSDVMIKTTGTMARYMASDVNALTKAVTKKSDSRLGGERLPDQHTAFMASRNQTHDCVTQYQAAALFATAQLKTILKDARVATSKLKSFVAASKNQVLTEKNLIGYLENCERAYKELSNTEAKNYEYLLNILGKAKSVRVRVNAFLRERASYVKAVQKIQTALEQATVTPVADPKPKADPKPAGEQAQNTPRPQGKVLTEHAYTAMRDELAKHLKAKKLINAGHKPDTTIKQIAEVVACAGDADKVNAFLRKQGVGQTVSSNPSAAGVMKIDIKWSVKAKPHTIKGYKASKHEKLANVHHAVVDGLDVYRITAKNGNYMNVYMPTSDEHSSPDFLAKVVAAKFKQANVMLAVPNVALKTSESRTDEIKAALLPLAVNDEARSLIDSAVSVMDTEFTMDEVGAKVVQVAVTRFKSANAGPRLVTIDRTFVALMTRKGVKIPVFAALCDNKVWIKA